MAPVNESRLPSGTQARKRFMEAMGKWDEEGSDVAVTALVRNAGAGEIIELFWRYGARDFRDIGHKAIYVANSWRTLQAIGWRHAEPVLRSLAYAVLEHEQGNPAQRDAEPDRPWRENQKRATQIRAGWQEGNIKPEATKDLLQALRNASHGEACEEIVKTKEFRSARRKVAPASYSCNSPGLSASTALPPPMRCTLPTRPAAMTRRAACSCFRPRPFSRSSTSAWLEIYKKTARWTPWRNCP